MSWHSIEKDGLVECEQSEFQSFAYKPHIKINKGGKTKKEGITIRLNTRILREIKYERGDILEVAVRPIGVKYAEEHYKFKSVRVRYPFAHKIICPMCKKEGILYIGNSSLVAVIVHRRSRHYISSYKLNKKNKKLFKSMITFRNKTLGSEEVERIQ